MSRNNREKAPVSPVFIVLLIVLVALALLLANCGGESEPENTPEPKDSSAPVSTSTPEVEETPTPEATPSPAPAVTSGALPETADAGQEYIDRLVFLGDSTTYGLKAYDVVDGDQVWTPSSGTLALFNQAVATIVYPKTGAEILITDAVADAQPEYMVLTIGVNGVSMMDEDAFKSDYTALVQRIQSVSPGTKIICNSIYPVESTYEAKNNGINNAKINAANGWILEVAEQTGCGYTDSASVLKGSDGCLIPEYGNGDGIHLCTAGFEAVLQYLRTHKY